MFKSIKLVNEDCHTNVVFQYHNVASYGCMQVKTYKALLNLLTQGDEFVLNLDKEIVQNYAIGLGVAAKFYNIKFKYYLSDKDQLTLFKLYTIYILNLSGGEYCEDISQQQNVINDITQQHMDQSLKELINMLYQQISEYEYYHNIHFKAKLFPAELTIYTYQDFYHICRKLNNSFKFVIEVPDTHFRDYFSWIQNIIQTANIFNFFYNINKNKNNYIDDTDIRAYLQQFNIKLSDETINGCLQQPIQNYNYINDTEDMISTNNRTHSNVNIYSNYTSTKQTLIDLDVTFDAIFDREKCIFKQKIPESIKDFIWVDHNEVLTSFASFLSNTHTLAAGMYLTPYTYIKSSRHAFTAKDTVLVSICGSLLTNKQFNAQSIYTRNYLLKSLQLNNEIVQVQVTYNTTRTSLTAMLFEAAYAYNLQVAQAILTSSEATLKLYSPGSDKLIQFVMALRQIAEFDNIVCPNLQESNRIQPETQNYGDIHTNFDYKPELTQIEQLNVENINSTSRQLLKAELVDELVTIQCQQINDIVQAQVILCMENLQQSGSFKIRGASNLLKNINSQLDGQQVNIIACSAGNHAQGVSLAAQRLNMKATIVMPKSAPVTKQYNVKRYGAELVLHGKVFDEAAQKAQELVKHRRGIFASPYNDLYVIQGQATIAAELIKLYPDVSAIYVPTGGSGMLSGITIYAKQMEKRLNHEIKCIGVQAEEVFPLKTIKQKHEYDKSINPDAVTLADGCNVKHPGGVQNQILEDCVDNFISVPENSIAAAIIEFLMYTKTLAEGAGVLAISAIINKEVCIEKGKQIACVISGGNIDISKLSQIFKLGEIRLGQRVLFQVKVPDKPGELMKISKLVQCYSGVLDNIRHIRSQDLQWDQTIISCEVQTCCRQAGDELKNKIKEIYGDNAKILTQ